MSQIEALELLLGGSEAKSFSFKERGATIEGTIVDYVKAADTDLEGKPRFWPSGDPKFQVILTLQTTLQEDEEDDGRRRIFVNKVGMKNAIADALRASNWRKNIVGGVLKLQFHAEEPPKQRGHNGVKLFRARFTPPHEVVPFVDAVAAVERAYEAGRALPDRTETRALPDNGVANHQGSYGYASDHDAPITEDPPF